MDRKKHKLSGSIGLATLALGLASLIVSCDIDHGLEPLVGKVAGRVIFFGEKPANTDQVRVAVARKFPPKAIGDLAWTAPLDMGVDPDTLEYDIPLPVGTYDAIGVLWKEKDRSWQITDVLGILSHLDENGSLELDKIELRPDRPVVDTVDVFANFRNVARGSVLEGTIHFEGKWPDDTEIMALAVYPAKPTNDAEKVFTLKGLDISIPTLVSEYSYSMKVTPGTIGYIVLYWKQLGTPLTDFKTLGFYADPNDPTVPGTLRVAHGDTVRGGDIVADFAKVLGQP